jgi:hypothetical protein
MKVRLSTGAMRVASASNAVLGTVASLPLIWLCWKYWYFYPLWDGAIYYEAIAHASTISLNPLSYNIAGHPSMGYLWLPGLLMHWLGASYRIVLVYNAVLAWYFATAVTDMASRLLRGEHRALDLVLVTAAVVCNPVITASVLQLTPDFGVLVFLTLATRALMRMHWITALGWGVLAGLSKESGALLFVMHLAAYLVVFAARAPHSLRSKWRALIRYGLMLGVPALLLVSAGLIRLVRSGTSLWANVELMGIVRQFATVSFLDNLLPASLATIFVLNCMWLPSLVVMVAAAVWGIRRLVLALPVRVSRDPAFELAVAAFVIDAFFLTRFRTFTNVRYYLPVLPWIVLLAARALLALGLCRAMRRLAQATMLLFTVASNFRSFDPFSEAVFGSMRFGEHRLFRITSITGECCGLGRDQLVYNLEFAEIEWLLRQVYPFVLAHADDHAIATHPEADWKFFDSIDPTTLRRATPRPGSFRVPNTHSWAIATAPVKPRKAYYIDLPNMANCAEITRLSAYYHFDWRVEEFEHDGYRIDVHELTLK